jgi:hypothetical protein
MRKHKSFHIFLSNRGDGMEKIELDLKNGNQFTLPKNAKLSLEKNGYQIYLNAECDERLEETTYNIVCELFVKDGQPPIQPEGYFTIGEMSLFDDGLKWVIFCKEG